MRLLVYRCFMIIYSLETSVKLVLGLEGGSPDGINYLSDWPPLERTTALRKRDLVQRSGRAPGGSKST